MADGDMITETGAGGWMRFPVAGLPGPLLLRFLPDDHGRLRVRELYLPSDDDEPIEARHLRSLRLHQLEAVANSPLMRKAWENSLDEPVPDLRAQLYQDCAWDEMPTAAALPPLPQPEGLRYDDHFYGLVAEHYRARLTTGRRPAHELAAASGVPVTTVHRWVREARRRGFLPATQKGRAG